MRNQHIGLFLIAIMAAVGLTGPALAEKEGNRTCRIAFPERPKSAPKVAYLFDGKSSRPVTLPSMNFSEVISLPAGDIMILMTSAEITDPENPPQDAPKLKITETVGDFYILITPDPANPALPVQMNLVNTGDGKLKPGETLWFNRTDHLIVAKLGDNKMSVTPRSSTISKSPVAISGYYRAEFAYKPLAKGDFQGITEQNWWHDAACRHVGFIVNTGGRLPKIYFYRDFR